MRRICFFEVGSSYIANTMRCIGTLTLRSYIVVSLPPEVSSIKHCLLGVIGKVNSRWGHPVEAQTDEQL